MSATSNFCIQWSVSDLGELRAVKCDLKLLQLHSNWLAQCYNEPYNQEMMGNSQCFTSENVIEYYQESWQKGNLMFLLFVGDEIVGDADYRNCSKGCAEFVIMIGSRNWQGKSLGTNFGIMLHHFAFDFFQFKKIYSTILPQNKVSIKLFNKLGYSIDNTPAAKKFADSDVDLCFSISDNQFNNRYSNLLNTISFSNE